MITRDPWWKLLNVLELVTVQIEGSCHSKGVFGPTGLKVSFVNSLPMDQNPKTETTPDLKNWWNLPLSSLSPLSSWSFIHFSLVPLSKFFYTEIHKEVVLFHYIIFHKYLTCIIYLRRFCSKGITISEIQNDVIGAWNTSITSD